MSIWIHMHDAIRWGNKWFLSYLILSYNLWQFTTTGPMYFIFLSSLPLLHHDSVWILPVISLLLANTVSPVRACLIIWWERFCGTLKEDDRGPLSIQSSLVNNKEISIFSSFFDTCMKYSIRILFLLLFFCFSGITILRLLPLRNVLSNFNPVFWCLGICLFISWSLLI